jgi:hypothetical protein
MGLRGLRVDDPEKLSGILEEAFAESGPVLIDAIVDEKDPMFPPRRREEYMKHLKQAFDKGPVSGRKSSVGCVSGRPSCRFSSEVLRSPATR